MPKYIDLRVTHESGKTDLNWGDTPENKKKHFEPIANELVEKMLDIGYPSFCFVSKSDDSRAIKVTIDKAVKFAVSIEVTSPELVLLKDMRAAVAYVEAFFTAQDIADAPSDYYVQVPLQHNYSEGIRGSAILKRGDSWIEEERIWERAS